jgi:CRP/FNR family transcriptional regulator
LIVDLKDRLARRGMVQSETTEMDFPLRRHHIADATGLTPVHVCKVLSDFRRSGVFKISDRSLTILDPIKFRSIALTR